MTLQQLHYFVVTANMRSFTRAAEACMVSQPALSHAIRELEQELGCDLFERCGRCVILTLLFPLLSRFLSMAKELLA